MSAQRKCEPEAVVERRILRALGGDPALILCRNEVGQAIPLATARASIAAALAPFGEHVKRAGLAALQHGRITYGLGVGSPDLVGALSVGGRALAIGIEVKAEDGTVSDEQSVWHRAARARGVAVGVARSADEAAEFVERVRRGG